MNNYYDILSLIRMFLKKWWLLLGLALFFAVANITISSLLTVPTYKATGSLFVRNTGKSLSTLQSDKGNDVRLDELMTSQELLKTYIEILGSDRFQNRVRKISGINYPNTALKEMISMQSKNETEVLEISVVSPNPSDTYILLETILAASSHEIEQIVGGGSIKILDNALYPTKPVSKHLQKKGVIGFMFGLILAAAIIYLTEILDKRVKNTDDLASKYNLYVLGEIPSIVSK